MDGCPHNPIRGESGGLNIKFYGFHFRERESLLYMKRNIVVSKVVVVVVCCMKYDKRCAKTSTFSYIPHTLYTTYVYTYIITDLFFNKQHFIIIVVVIVIRLASWKTFTALQKRAHFKHEKRERYEGWKKLTSMSSLIKGKIFCSPSSSFPSFSDVVVVVVCRIYFHSTKLFCS